MKQNRKGQQKLESPQRSRRHRKETMALLEIKNIIISMKTHSVGSTAEWRQQKKNKLEDRTKELPKLNKRKKTD